MATQSGNDPETVRKDRTYSPSSDEETRARQERPSESPTAKEGDVNEDAVTTKPGTGGPDDAGDVEVDEEAIRARIAGGGNAAEVDRDASEDGVGESGSGEQPRGS